MYFAFDHPSDSVARQLICELQSIFHAHKGKPIHVFALIDGAFDENLFSERFRTDCRRISLYQGTELDGFGNAAPFLVELSASKLENELWIDKLLTATGSRPMWSVIATAIDMQATAQHLARFLIAQSDDELLWPVRIADARVIPALHEAFEAELIDDLMWPFYGWFATSRGGSLVSWPGSGSSELRSNGPEKLPMSDSAFKRLMEISEADTVLSQIHTVQPELLATRLPSTCYQLIQKQLKVANKYNIDQPNTRQHFSTMALFLNEDFVEMPEMKLLLKNVMNGSPYMNEVRKLPDDFWARAAIRHNRD